MTRDIKFRAIEKPSDMVIQMGYKPKMVYGTGIFKDRINTWLLSHDNDKCLADGFQEHIVDKNTIGQYTGLKDQKGVEIYEGDIIRMTSRFGESYKTFKAKMEFQGGSFWFVGIDFNFTDCNWHFYNSEDREVIGNIWENPELLKDKTNV